MLCLLYTRSGQQILNREIGYVDGLNAHDWDKDAQEKLEDTMLTSTQEFYCGGGRGVTDTLQYVQIIKPNTSS